VIEPKSSHWHRNTGFTPTSIAHGLGLVDGHAKLEELLEPGARRLPLAPLDVAQVMT
jgi:hypothetical protein